MNKVAIVTGAGSGIGRAIALLFAQHGARVVIADISDKLGRETIELIERSSEETKGANREAIFVRSDISKAEDSERIVQESVRVFGGLHILVNNAGIQRPGTVETISDEDWDMVLSVNLKGPFLVSKFAIPAMRKSGGGSIVNMGSDAGLVGNPGIAAYCASKGGIVALTRAMALDHAKDKIRVNCICPGAVDAPLHNNWFQTLTPTEQEDWRKRVAIRYPLARVGKPEEIANLALFLASEESSFMTGSIVTIDGGLTAQ